MEDIEEENFELQRGGSARKLLNNTNANSASKLNGGELKTGFIEYITTISSNEKAQLLNMLQYGGLAILPLLVLLKFMKMYVPEDQLKELLN